MTSGDVVAIIGATATLITAGAGAVSLVRRHSDEMSKKEIAYQENRDRLLRVYRRIVAELRDLLADHGIAEPEGIDDEIRGRQRAGSDAEA